MERSEGRIDTFLLIRLWLLVELEEDLKTDRVKGINTERIQITEESRLKNKNKNTLGTCTENVHSSC